jgi:hypothetical protein
MRATGGPLWANLITIALIAVVGGAGLALLVEWGAPAQGPFARGARLGVSLATACVITASLLFVSVKALRPRRYRWVRPLLWGLSAAITFIAALSTWTEITRRGPVQLVALLTGFGVTSGALALWVLFVFAVIQVRQRFPHGRA